MEYNKVNMISHLCHPCNLLTKKNNTMKQIKQISCLLSLAWPSGGAQASRVLNQCHQWNLLTKKNQHDETD